MKLKFLVGLLLCCKAKHLKRTTALVRGFSACENSAPPSTTNKAVLFYCFFQYLSISALYEKLFLPNAMSGTSGVVWLAFYSIFRSAFKSSPGRNRLSKAGTFSDLPRFHPSGINGTLTGYANAGKTDPFSPGTGAAPAGCSLSTFSSSVSVRVSRRGAEFQPAHLPSQKSPT